MATLSIEPVTLEQLRAAASAGGGVPMLVACRAVFTFVADPPLDMKWFPGPALRGLLGRSLERTRSPEAAEFLRQRFRTFGGSTPALWRMGFTRPPDPSVSTFDADFACFGPAAADDLEAIAAAFALPGLHLDLPRRRFDLALRSRSRAEAAIFRLGQAEECGAARRHAHLLTPLVIHHAGKALAARALAANVRPLLDSLRLRFADLAGIRRDSPQLPQFCEAVAPSEAALRDVLLHLPLQGRHRALQGIVGTLSWEALPIELTGWLDAATWLGAGRNTAFGAGTIVTG